MRPGTGRIPPGMDYTRVGIDRTRSGMMLRAGRNSAREWHSGYSPSDGLAHLPASEAAPSGRAVSAVVMTRLVGRWLDEPVSYLQRRELNWCVLAQLRAASPWARGSAQETGASTRGRWLVKYRVLYSEEIDMSKQRRCSSSGR